VGVTRIYEGIKPRKRTVTKKGRRDFSIRNKGGRTGKRTKKLEPRFMNTFDALAKGHLSWLEQYYKMILF